MTPRQRHYAERRLSRLARRADAARGHVMNLDWLTAFGDWCELHDLVCSVPSMCTHMIGEQ